ncbi:alkyl hydroperoxide reductase subunit D [Crossiella equi]|uniref:Alkyl hydroperoxide reductase AhpD n=1 Tax=Crossiella equi TaxID=130796 RepID=A0ABS5AED4_9PSEU|nr:carboxymuconolactone decarboxylase family protein [Crossiella equi]MBP2474953.1 alkyl hydroperoxide reductase subunit D [Crossiella equi]
MTLSVLRGALPAYAEDLRHNLGEVLDHSPLTGQQLWGTVLAVAVTAGEPTVLRAVLAEAGEHLSTQAVDAAKAAASVMAMNNVFYRAKHLLADEEYGRIPGRLRMKVVARPGVAKLDFELWCVAASAVNNCQICLETHERNLRRAGVPAETVHEVLRVAAVVHAVIVVQRAETALAER